MKVIADFHHGDLYESLRILFEDRLGGQLYRPIGMDWRNRGYWALYDHPETAQQFLSAEMTEEYQAFQRQHPPGSKEWVNAGCWTGGDGIYHIPDHDHGGQTKGILLDAARAMPVDIIISSIPGHFALFERLRQEAWPNAKHIFQSGNMWPIPPGVKNLMNSTTWGNGDVPNAINYHQEFSRKRFRPSPPQATASVFNLMHYQRHHFENDFYSLRNATGPGWEFMNFGCGNEHGPIIGSKIDEVLRRAHFIWHCKQGGDGYGHNIHQAFACGKPMVIRGNYCMHQTAGPLFTDGETVIDLDRHTIPEAAQMLRDAFGNWHEWSDRVQKRFAQVVDFDAEFQQIKLFIERLV